MPCGTGAGVCMAGVAIVARRFSLSADVLPASLWSLFGDAGDVISLCIFFCRNPTPVCRVL